MREFSIYRGKYDGLDSAMDLLCVVRLFSSVQVVARRGLILLSDKQTLPTFPTMPKTWPWIYRFTPFLVAIVKPWFLACYTPLMGMQDRDYYREWWRNKTGNVKRPRFRFSMGRTLKPKPWHPALLFLLTVFICIAVYAVLWSISKFWS